MTKRKKIALIGAGNIGGELAAQISRMELGDVVLFDIPDKENFAKGKALDLEQDQALSGRDASVIGSSNWADCAGADVLIITAGIPRKPGQDREDLIASNLPIIRDVADNAKKHCPEAMAIIVSNPLDVMVYEFKRRTGWPKQRVVGMAGMLDSSRFELFLAREAGVSVKDVRAMVLGGHGDRTRKGGGEIVGLMGTSAYYTPATAAVQMAEAYLHDQKRMVACAAYLEGEYGLKDMYMGVPVIIGAGGIEKVIEIELSADEKEMLGKSAKAVRGVMEIVDKMS